MLDEKEEKRQKRNVEFGVLLMILHMSIICMDMRWLYRL